MSLGGLLIKHIGLLSKSSSSSFAKVSTTVQYALSSPGLFYFFSVGIGKRNLGWNPHKKNLLCHSRKCNLDGHLQSATLLVMAGEAYPTKLAWSLLVCANLQDIKKMLWKSFWIHPAFLLLLPHAWKIASKVLAELARE